MSSWSAGAGMKSVTETIPEAVRKVVWRTLVSATYSCRVSMIVAVGLIRKWPPMSGSSMAAKTLGESNRGKQHQSMEPSVPTSAAEDMLPISP